MSAQLQVQGSAELPTRRRSIAGLLAAAGALVAGCSQNSQYLSSAAPPQSPHEVGRGRREERERQSGQEREASGDEQWVLQGRERHDQARQDEARQAGGARALDVDPVDGAR